MIGRVLIVDDHDGVRRALARLFRSVGVEATAATGVADARAKLDGHCVVILDLQLADGLGTDVLRLLRTSAHPARVAVYSSLAGADAIVAASGERPEAVFRKPDDSEAMLEWVLAALRDRP